MITSRFVVYTALFGNYDVLKELTFKSYDCDYICFTDQDIYSETWKIVKLQCNEADSILMNRKIKMLPHIYLSKYDASLYVDTNIKITKDVLPIFHNYLVNYSIAFPRHFIRNCIYDEIEECLNINKICKEEGEYWKSFLEKDGFPKQFGLGENNIILRNHHDLEIKQLMDNWWELFKTEIKRDQLTLMYLIRKMNIKFHFMKESSRNNNPYFIYYLHNTDNNLSFLKKKLAFISARRNKNKFYYLSHKIIEFLKRI